MSEGGTAVSRLYFPHHAVPDIAGHETPLLTEGRHQLLEYFAGRRTQFDLPVCPAGTPFQEKIWALLRAIPYGETRSYGNIAAAAGAPGAARAVGGACHRNPIPILIPCHRVIGTGGSLTGFAGGLVLKQQLLAMERKAVTV